MTWTIFRRMSPSKALPMTHNISLAESMKELDRQKKQAVRGLLQRLVDQDKAQIIVPTYATKPGYWFGGGNLLQDDKGVIWLCGRYRNAGDSRTGLAAGERGLECAVFRSDDLGHSFKKVLSWSKADLSQAEAAVLSIEGTALHRRADGNVELFVSLEKKCSYPNDLAHYQKPGTGVWSIDRMVGRSVEQLDPATLTTVLENHDRPEYLHLKDPVVFDGVNQETVMFFCSHPFTWASGNTGLATRRPGNTQFDIKSWEIVRRGAAWDVASTRITGRVRIPAMGVFSTERPCWVYFYDGCECVRELPENDKAHHRPRGYSCEEIGGALFGRDESLAQLQRLSDIEPFFVSPHGSGSSRYADALLTTDGLIATWQQSQADGSQPLVRHFVSRDEIESVLRGTNTSQPTPPADGPKPSIDG